MADEEEDGTIWDAYRAQDIERKATAEVRRAQAGQDYRAAKAKATQLGLTLLRHAETHYSLRGPGWVLDLYPGNQRIVAKEIQSKPPWLEFNHGEWRLMDAVIEAAKGNQKTN